MVFAAAVLLPCRVSLDCIFAVCVRGHAAKCFPSFLFETKWPCMKGSVDQRGRPALRRYLQAEHVTVNIFQGQLFGPSLPAHLGPRRTEASRHPPSSLCHRTIELQFGVGSAQSKAQAHPQNYPHLPHHPRLPRLPLPP